MSLLLAVLLQVGPAPGAGSGAASQLPPEIRDRKPRTQVWTRPVRPPVVPSQDETCASEEQARAKRDAATGVARAEAALCLGLTLSDQQRWAEAEAVFADGRDAAQFQTPIRARLGSMAASAALAQGAAERALAQLDIAVNDLGGERVGTVPLAITLDRARALVALKRLDQAEAQLAEARALASGNAEAWLLSATLSRRLNKLDEAQTRIEKAAQLSPVDPEIGLEAGVIAMLAGREAAARKSWQSVIAAAPQSPSAEAARGYLAQLSTPENTKP